MLQLFYLYVGRAGPWFSPPQAAKTFLLLAKGKQLRRSRSCKGPPANFTATINCVPLRHILYKDNRRHRLIITKLY